MTPNNPKNIKLVSVVFVSTDTEGIYDVSFIYKDGLEYRQISNRYNVVEDYW